MHEQEEEFERISQYMDMSNALFVLYAKSVSIKIAHEAQRNADFLFAVVSDENRISKDYPFDNYLDLLIGGYYIEIDNNSNELSGKLNLVYEAKDKLLEMVYHGKNAIGKRNDIIIDFDGRIERINSKIEKLQTQLQMQKYDLEVKKLRYETANFARFYPLIISSLAIIISIVALILNYNKAQNKPVPTQLQIQKEK